jgi:hypothetical protein
VAIAVEIDDDAGAITVLAVGMSGWPLKYR